MAKQSKLGKVKGPGGTTLCELHQRMQQGRRRAEAAGKQHNPLSQPQNRWQRAVRYVWDKNRGRG